MRGLSDARRLNLMVTAIIFWNTLELARTDEELQPEGMTITTEQIAHPSPIAKRHGIPKCTFTPGQLYEIDPYCVQAIFYHNVLIEAKIPGKQHMHSVCPPFRSGLPS